MTNDKTFKNTKTGEKVSAYKYGRDIIIDDWKDMKDMKDSGAICSTSSDFDGPNFDDESCLELGIGALSIDKNYVEC